MPFDPSKYTVSTAKPMPVFLLLDVSGSMSGLKIEELNQAVEEMLKAFTREEVKIVINMITFGDRVDFKMQQQTVQDAIDNWVPLNASGMTPMGMALKMAKDLIEDREIVPSKSYRPLVVLVSDGEPTDEWEGPMKDFITTGRSQKCQRLAMAIGEGANQKILNKFIEGQDLDLFFAKNASDINKFFKLVTMTVTQTTQAVKPKAQDSTQSKLGDRMPGQNSSSPDDDFPVF